MQEFVDFLAKHSPYDQLDADDLARLGDATKVEYFPAGTSIVGPDVGALEYLAVIRSGVVTVLDRSQVVDELGPGDTFGQFSVLSGLPPSVTARATSDTLLYLLPDPRKILEHPERLAFENADRSVARHSLLAGTAVDPMLRRVTSFMVPPLWCEHDTTIRDAARAMTDARRSCVLVRVGPDLGIVTDSDCRRLVATGEVPVDAPLSAIASVPARAIAYDESAGSALVMMVHHGVHHLVITDGADQAVGVCRVVDLSATDIRDPLTVRSAIEAAGDIDALVAATEQLRPVVVELRDAGIPPLRVGALLSAMIEAVVAKCIGWVDPFAGDLDEPAYSWLLLGSLARREPLPMSDVDTALVWSGIDPGRLRPPIETAAGQVLDLIERCGLRRCPDGANADNPLFNHSFDQWVSRAQGWMAHSDGPGALLLSSMLADSRPLTGLLQGRRLQEQIRAIPGDETFLRRALLDVVHRKPPTGFVKDFVVEPSGEHKGQLDLKRGGIGPIVAIGRWIALRLRAPISTTPERLRLGAQEGLLSSDEAAQLERAHHEIYGLVFSNEIELLRAGAPVSTFLDPKGIDSLGRRHLRQSFKAITRVQDRLESEWLGRVR